MNWPKIETVMSDRLRLEPLSVEHAPEMVDVLADASIYEYTGGEAPSLEQLERRFTAQAIGHSADELQGWFNWVVKAKDSNVPMGIVQATVERNGKEMVANIAWVIAPIHQGQGIASEASVTMSRWLQSQGVNSFVANIHPEHDSSMGVALHQALHPTPTTENGEIRWES
ncbi:GNAT family N-acetyltransferase [Arthrobacter sp. TMN-49]